MTGGHDVSLERLSELLADRATQCLSATESAELISMLAAHPEVDEHAFDRTVAALDLSSIAAEYQPLPPSLREQVDRGAVAWLAQRKGLRLADIGSAGSDAESPTVPQKPRGVMPWVPWLVAAACLTLVVVTWWPSREAASPPAQRTALLSSQDTRTIAWANNEAGVSGDVVWNGQQQAGFMRISGLAVNDPAVFQYQLWIFDEARRGYSDDVAVDGGVFDIDQATGDVIIPIRSKLPVAEPFLFAVTTEPPGGVVKHNPERDPDRYRIVLATPL
jgi:hypothetical protein